MRGNEGRSGSGSGSGSSCAACKLLKRKCVPTCIFAPHFRSDEPKKFAKVHKVFGASNVSKILADVSEEQREETVNSLAYEAEARLRDPVYGCIGAIASLQRKMIELQQDLAIARAKLAGCYATAFAASSCNHHHHHHRVGLSPAFSDLDACGGLTDYFSPNSLESNQFQAGDMCDLGQVPYV